MAVTSFDKVVSFLTFPRWKWPAAAGVLCGVLIIVPCGQLGCTLALGLYRMSSLALWLFCLGWKLGALRPSWLALSHEGNQKVFTFFGPMARHGDELGVTGVFPASRGSYVAERCSDWDGRDLHITPDDDPVAGEKTSFLFDIQDASLLKKCLLQHSQLLMINSTKPMCRRGCRQYRAATYTFPSQVCT